MSTVQHEPVTRTDEPEQRRRPFVQLPTDIVRDATLSDRALRFYAEVRSYAWEALDSECYASQTTLARDLGWCVDKVQRAARECQERGLIVCRRTGRTNFYSVPDHESAATDTAIHRQQIPPESGNRYRQGAVQIRPREEDDREPDEEKNELCSRRNTSCETTTTADLASEADVENLLDAYECAIEWETGRKPTRRPGDVEAAERLIASGAVPEGDDGSTEFAEVVGWGLRDSYSRQRLVGGMQVAAKCYAPLASKFAGARTVSCARCEETFKLAPHQASAVERGEAALCPECESIPLSGPTCSQCERRVLRRAASAVCGARCSSATRSSSDC